MKVQKAMMGIRMQEWLRQIHECQQSGLTITEWCSINGINPKTYYFRRRRVREELLDVAEPSGPLVLSNNQSVKVEAPVFAAVPTSKISSIMTAATVHIGTYIAEINNGAELETVDGVLRTLSRL